MISWVFILFVVIAFIMLFALIFQNQSMGFFWTVCLCIMTIIMFFVCAAGIMELEIPYQYWNNSSITLETGYQVIINEENVFMSYFFGGFAIFTLLFFVGYLFKYVGDFLKKRGIK